MYFLNVPPISLLDDRDPPSKILKEPRGLYASKVADLMTSWQTIPRWPAESQVFLSFKKLKKSLKTYALIT